jgi:hypothetical protein
MECIICQDSGSELLQDNTSCKCKYKRHISCWINYVHSRKNVICPLCRKDLTIKPTSKTSNRVPYTPQLSPIPEEQRQQNTYQNIDENVSYNSYQNTSNERRSLIQPQTEPRNIPTSKKILNIIIGLSVLAVLVTIFVVLVI